MCVDNVVASWACFGSGVVSRLFAEDALERTIALAGNAVIAWALIDVFLHGMVAVTSGAAYFPGRNRTFLGEVRGLFPPWSRLGGRVRVEISDHSGRTC